MVTKWNPTCGRDDSFSPDGGLSPRTTRQLPRGRLVVFRQRRISLHKAPAPGATAHRLGQRRIVRSDGTDSRDAGPSRRTMSRLCGPRRIVRGDGARSPDVVGPLPATRQIRRRRSLVSARRLVSRDNAPSSRTTARCPRRCGEGSGQSPDFREPPALPAEAWRRKPRPIPPAAARRAGAQGAVRQESAGSALRCIQAMRRERRSFRTSCIAGSAIRLWASAGSATRS